MFQKIKKNNPGKAVRTFAKPGVYQPGQSAIKETEKYFPEITGPHTICKVFENVAPFKEWMIAGGGKYIVGHISIHPPADTDIRADEVVQLSAFSTGPDALFQPVLIAVKSAEDVRQILQVIENHSPAKDFRELWTLDDSQPVWDKKPAKSVAFNARNYHDSAKFRGWNNFLLEYEEASDDRNYVFGWSCDKVHLRLFIHQQRITDLKVITIIITPGNGPYIREYLKQKAKYVQRSLAV
jgi:hypothetical protein